MKIEIYTNPEFSRLEQFLELLPKTFQKEGQSIKNDRNEIKIIWSEQLKLCVKSFKRVTLFNRLMYSWFRASKAKRSYKNARRLGALHLNTPTPVGYVEVYNRWHILKQSYYVSFYQEHDCDLSSVLAEGIDDWAQILASFSQYMASVVHPSGVWHNDLTPGNVFVIKRDQGQYAFSFIDLNRIKFKRHIFHVHGLTNLKKLTNHPVMLAIMAEKYAMSVDQEPLAYAYWLLKNNLFHRLWRSVSKGVLHRLPFAGRHKKKKECLTVK